MARFSINIAVMSLAIVGCNPVPDTAVQGTVTVEGELAKSGIVVFHPVEGGAPAYGAIFENGTYSLRVGQGEIETVDGSEVAAGEYVVTVVVNAPPAKKEDRASGPPTPGPRLTAAKYADKETSGLRVIVKRGANVIPLEVEGADGDEELNTDESNEQPTDQTGEAAEATEQSSDPAADGTVSVGGTETEANESNAASETATEEAQP
jgi:hypothetical protein